MFLLDVTNKDMLFKKVGSNFDEMSLTFWETLPPLTRFSVYLSKKMPSSLMMEVITDYLTLKRDYEIKKEIDLEKEMTDNPTCIACGSKAKVLNTKNNPICTTENELAIKYWKDDVRKIDHIFHVCEHCNTITPDDFMIFVLNSVLVGDFRYIIHGVKREKEKDAGKIVIAR